ncbi:MAG: hypothetical protein V4772_08665 [Pseudomonadota bacterium]
MVHVFNETSIFRVFEPDIVFEWLIVGGGGAGGGYFGGGGGGGGVVYEATGALAVGGHPVIVGGGGVTYPETEGGTPGGNSSLDAYVADGGGAGGVGGEVLNANPATDGGSGGGGASSTPALDPGVGTLGQGNDGGTGGPASGDFNSAGGGGANAVGSDSDASNRGNGGDGLPFSITGTSVTYAGGGGGGGGSVDGGAGGTGGGGAGGLGDASNGLVITNAVAGTAGLGGGGGGGGVGVGTPGLAAVGGKGVVIIRYRFQETPPQEIIVIDLFNGSGSAEGRMPDDGYPGVEWHQSADPIETTVVDGKCTGTDTGVATEVTYEPGVVGNFESVEATFNVINEGNAGSFYSISKSTISMDDGMGTTLSCGAEIYGDFGLVTHLRGFITLTGEATVYGADQLPTVTIGEIFNFRLQIADGVQKVFLNDVEIASAAFSQTIISLIPSVSFTVTGGAWSLLDVNAEGVLPP